MPDSKTKRTKYTPFKTYISKPPSSKLKVNIKDSTTARATSIQVLGIIIQDYLSWKSQIKVLLHKVRISFGVIKKKKIKPNLNP